MKPRLHVTTAFCRIAYNQVSVSVTTDVLEFDSIDDMKAAAEAFRKADLVGGGLTYRVVEIP